MDESGVFSRNVERLGEAIREERQQRLVRTQEPGLAAWIRAANNTDAALAAVEQEIEALRCSYENASRAHFEAQKRIKALAECNEELRTILLGEPRDGG